MSAKRVITIAQAAVFLKTSNVQARVQLCRAQCLVFTDGKPRVPVDKFEELFNKKVPADIEAPTPESRQGYYLVSHLAYKLPLLAGTLTTIQQVKRAIGFSGKYSTHVYGNCTYYKLEEFENYTSWYTREEEVVRRILLDMKEPKGDLQKSIRDLLIKWQELLREDRTAGLRGAGKMSQDEFHQQYHETWRTIIDAPWKSVKDLLPPKFDHKSLIP